MGLLTPRLNTVFASRWRALWWAAGILATTYCTVQTLPGGEKKQDVSEARPAPAKADKPAPKNPWALDKPDGARDAH